MAFIEGTNYRHKVMDDTDLSAGAKLVWLALEDKADVTQRELMTLTSLGKRHIAYKIAELRERGYLQVGPGTNGRRRLYTVRGGHS